MSFRCRHRIFLFSKMSRPVLGPIQQTIQCICGFFPGLHCRVVRLGPIKCRGYEPLCFPYTLMAWTGKTLLGGVEWSASRPQYQLCRRLGGVSLHQPVRFNTLFCRLTECLCLMNSTSPVYFFSYIMKTYHLPLT